MNFLETASYSWNLNRDKTIVSRVFRTIGTTIYNTFFGHNISIKEIELLIKGNPEYYVECYFYKSLKKRRIEIDISKTTPNIVMPTEYKNHKRVAVDGLIFSGKSHFITALKGQNFGKGNNPYRELRDRQRCDSTQFYEFRENIVLCELHKRTIVECHINEPKRYDDYDFIIFTITCVEVSDIDVELMQIARNSCKPYLVVLTHIDQWIEDYDKHNTRDKTMEDKIIIDNYCKPITEQFKQLNIMPNNGKILTVDNGHSSKFDFKEASDLIKSQDFYGNDSD
ncbi:MAG: GTPase domain-containing protein [Endozoicomonadaceae bacterium]|nr:GTPase domain-containing protein [Endozoicomonadaceae bacterium]